MANKESKIPGMELNNGNIRITGDELNIGVRGRPTIKSKIQFYNKFLVVLKM